MPKKNAKPVLPQVARPTRWGVSDPEDLDTTPVEMPLGACRPTPLQDLIAQMVRQQVQQTSEEEFGTIEDEDDFDEIDPDTLDFSPYDLRDVNEEDLPVATIEPEGAPASHAVPGSDVPAEEPPEVVLAAQKILAAVAQMTGDPPDPNAVEPS